jgi:hypothetical protein
VDAFAMKACIDSVQKELAKVEVMAGAHRTDFERERKAERRMAELLKVTADAMAYAMAARESMARLEGELLAIPALVATAGRLVPARRRQSGPVGSAGIGKTNASPSPRRSAGQAPAATHTAGRP